MKITVIDNYDSFVYNLVRYLREIPEVEVTIQRNDTIEFSELEKADAILLSPGPGIPSEAGDLMKVIAQFVRTKPILGVCLGHQALAIHFGGKLELCPAPMHGKASVLTQENQSALFANLSKDFEVGRYHSWNVAHPLPNCLQITAKRDQDIMAFEHEYLPIYGVQFHPESILTPEGRAMIQNWVDVVSRVSFKKSAL